MCDPPLRSAGASHSLDKSPVKDRVAEGRSMEPRAWRAVSQQSEASARNSVHAQILGEDPNLCQSGKMVSTTSTSLRPPATL